MLLTLRDLEDNIYVMRNDCMSPSVQCRRELPFVTFLQSSSCQAACVPPPSRAAHVVKEGCTRPLSAGLCWNASYLLWSLAPCQHCLDLHGLLMIHSKSCLAMQCDISCERANIYSRAFCSAALGVTPGLAGFRGSCTCSLSWTNTCCLLSARHGANCLESTQSY